MGILKNLLVLGSAKFVNKIQGSITGDAGTVNSHTVEKDVPSDAVFTDTKPSAQCETAASTAAKTAACTYYTMKDNSYLHVNVRNSNTAASALTLNVNSKGAKPIYINGSASSSTNYTLPAGSYIAFYDGTNWYFRTDDKLPGNIDGDAATVGSYTVEKNVPSDAIFTDTTDLTQMTGTLPASKGGTGETTLDNASNAFINALATGLTQSTPEKTDYIITQYAGGNGSRSSAANANKYYRRPVQALFDAMESSDITTALGYSPAPSIYFGHCATAAATAVKVVELDNPTGFTLRNGVMICVSYDATNTASNVTLNVEGTGAKAISQVENTAYTGTSNTITGHTSYYTYYVYNGTYWCFVNYSANTTNNSDNFNKLAINVSAVVAGSAITATSIIVANSDGTYKNLKSGTSFDLSYPILYSTAAIDAGAKSTANTAGVYVAQYFAIKNTQSMTLTFPAPVYIKGTLSGTIFTPISTAPLTQTLPTTEDGYDYIYLGIAYSAANMFLYPNHPIYSYKVGKLRMVTSDGDVVNNTVTAGSVGPDADVIGDDGATIVIPRLTIDMYGRITGYTTHTLINRNNIYSAGTGISLANSTFSNSGVVGIKGTEEDGYRTGNVILSKANLGLGNVENKSSQTIRSEITASNITSALGYTPYTRDEVDSLISVVYRYKGTKATYANITSLTTKTIGDVWYCTATSKSYCWDGSAWNELGSMNLGSFYTGNVVRATSDISL